MSYRVSVIDPTIVPSLVLRRPNIANSRETPGLVRYLIRGSVLY
jgi:hypothetical protein